MFEAINHALEGVGQIMRGGSVMDATIINAPSSTKNEKKERGPKMHQVKKGNEWRFGMKAHIGVSAVEGTGANVHDITVALKLIRRDDKVVYGDSGYLGTDKRDEVSSDPDLSLIDYRINRRPNHAYRKYANDGQAWEKTIEHQKSSVRSKVEFPFRFIKVQCGFRKTVYKGIAKNLNRLQMLFVSANLYSCARAGRSLQPLVE